MIACLDVQYDDPRARAACVVIHDWPDAVHAEERTAVIEKVEPYVPGQFYKRELPCLLAVLAELDAMPDFIVVDSYVWLGPNRKRGMGAEFYEKLGRRIPVIGVAKTAFHDTPCAIEVTRGQSVNPLYVNAAGINPTDAARHIAAMHGPYRLPTMLKRADDLARGKIKPD